MSTISITPVILSGGAGTRLWPLSHHAAPKQFHKLASDHTLLQDTALRLGSSQGLAFNPPIVICADHHGPEIDRQLREVNIKPSRIILEPFGKNTAAAAYIAARLATEMWPDTLVLLLPADHVIEIPDIFLKAVADSAAVAGSRIVTFGVHPEGPETGYGYIQQGISLGNGVFDVERFVEKPSASLAAEYLAEGGYCWNAGIFLFSPKVMMSEMEQHAPLIARTAGLALTNALTTGDCLRLDPDAFSKCPSEPLDVAVMEKTGLAAVTPCSMGWADLGSWSEIFKRGPFDDSGNVLHGHVVNIETQNSLIWSDGRPVAVIGLTNIGVVSTAEGVVVFPLERAQDIKLAVSAAKQLGKAP